MKRFWFLLLLSSSVGCQQNEVGIGLPALDKLYRTWRLTKVSYDGQVEPFEQYLTVVTFPRDGRFLRGQQKDYRWCWMPFSFGGTDEVVRFTWDTLYAECGLINGKMSPLRSGIDWQIMTLTEERLVLIGNERMLTYEPAP